MPRLFSFLRTIAGDIFRRPSLYLFIVLIVFTLDRHNRYEFSVDKRFGPFYGDVLEYYTFLPEYFLDYKQVEGIHLGTNRRTVGMALMYAPGFLAGHTLAHLTGEEKTGYTWPYQWAIRWGSILYVLAGLLFCRYNLRRFFGEAVTAVTLAALFWASNLFYYTYGGGEFSHGYLFFLYSAFIFFTRRWLDGKPGALILLSGLAGLAILIRPTSVLILLFPLLFGISRVQDLRDRLRLLFKHPGLLLLGAGLFCLPLLCQMLIWKTYFGQYVYYSYGRERFFFQDPQVLNFLFSYRKGWLVYSPLMIFSLAGLLFRKKLGPVFLFLWVYVPLCIYVLSSWWDWAYGGGFGCRALVESYAFLAFPLAAFVSWVWQAGTQSIYLNSGIRLALLLLFYALASLNLFQVRQFKYGRIHWNGMNKTSYWYVFMKQDLNEQDLRYLETQWKEPDPEQMLNGERDH